GKVCIHKDISPHNIMVSRLGAVKLIDFGISKTDESESAPQSDAVQGKYSYMSPEQARGGELTAASDVFSLAVIFYELISGLKFYGRNNEVGIIRVLDEWSDKDIQIRLLDIPNPTHREFLAQALAVDPKKRPKASEFLELFTQELTSYEEELTTEAIEKNLKYCLSEHRNKEVYGALPVLLVDGVPDLQNVTDSPFPTQFTLYDVLTEEKRPSRLWAPLLAMSFIGLLYVGNKIYQDPDKILGIGRQPSSTVVSSPSSQIVLSESLLLRIPDVGDEAQLQVNLNGRDLDAAEIAAGIKVFDGDKLVIRTQGKPGRKWKEHSMVIDTKAPPQFNFNL
ncbi:MAG: protein kinase, partial [Bdellovibrio sp.]|nr:protein kinase [Bdellovibrio sp.]